MAVPVTFPKSAELMLVFGSFQRTKLKGFTISARNCRRTFSVIGVTLPIETDSDFCENPRPQSSSRAVLPNAKLAGTAKADAAGSGVPSSAVYHSLRSVVVMPGQSLWSLATQYEPTADPRNVIQEIIDLNALNGTSVQPGQRLWLPRG